MSQSDDAATEVATDDGVVAEARAEGPRSPARAENAAEADRENAGTGPTPAPAPKGSLWRDRNFMTLWSGQALSQFGGQITELALPVLAVLILNASEWQVGVLGAAQFAAF